MKRSGEQATEWMGATAVQQTLRARLQGIHNFIYANDGIKQHARVSDELVKLLYVKLEAERDRGRQLVPRDGAARSAQDVHAAFARAIRRGAASGLFDARERIELSDDSIHYALGQLQGPPLVEQDPKGIAFQAVLGHSQRAELGQFFTPDPVKRLLIELTDPQNGEVVCDPASGSAGLLLDARAARPNADLELRAVEVDAALARMARLNLFLSGESSPTVFRTDALQPLESLRAATGGQIDRESIDVVVTNPPFGSRGKVTDLAVLADLPHVTAGKTAIPPEILFVERVVQLLRHGGRAGIVLPIGVMSNPSQRHIRDYLHATCQVYATVALPHQTFMPTGNGVNAAIVSVRRVAAVRHPYPVFRAVSRGVGYDHRGRIDPGRPDDVPAIVDCWHAFLRKHGKEHLWS